MTPERKCPHEGIKERKAAIKKRLKREQCSGCGNYLDYCVCPEQPSARIDKQEVIARLKDAIKHKKRISFTHEEFYLIFDIDLTETIKKIQARRIVFKP